MVRLVLHCDPWPHHATFITQHLGPMYPNPEVLESLIEGTCWPASVLINYGIFNAAWCAAADFALALLPWKLIWGLQLKLREKLGVGIAMSMGLLYAILHAEIAEHSLTSTVLECAPLSKEYT
jgi:hypothetical protein